VFLDRRKYQTFSTSPATRDLPGFASLVPPNRISDSSPTLRKTTLMRAPVTLAVLKTLKTV
jgi:hypothetical protein